MNRGQATRVDVLFVDVQFVKVPMSWDGLEIYDARAEEFEAILAESGFFPRHEYGFFVLRGNDYQGYVIASETGPRLHEDVAEWHEPSPIDPDTWHLTREGSATLETLESVDDNTEPS
jgi:hypothetical protein